MGFMKKQGLDEMNERQFEQLAYSIEQVSKLTTLSTSFLRREVNDGNLSACKVGRRVLIGREDLLAYLRDRTVMVRSAAN